MAATVCAEDIALLERLASNDVPEEFVALASKLIDLRRDSERLRRANSDLERSNALLSARIAEEARRTDV